MSTLLKTLTDEALKAYNTIMSIPIIRRGVFQLMLWYGVVKATQTRLMGILASRRVI